MRKGIFTGELWGQILSRSLFFDGRVDSTAGGEEAGDIHGELGEPSRAVSEGGSDVFASDEPEMGVGKDLHPGGTGVRKEMGEERASHREHGRLPAGRSVWVV